MSWRTTIAEWFNLTGVVFNTVTGTCVWTGIWISETELGCELGACNTGLVTGIGTKPLDLSPLTEAGLFPTPDERRCSFLGFFTLLGIP